MDKYFWAIQIFLVIKQIQIMQKFHLWKKNSEKIIYIYFALFTKTSLLFIEWPSLSLYIYIYIYVCVCTCACACVYVWVWVCVWVCQMGAMLLGKCAVSSFRSILIFAIFLHLIFNSWINFFPATPNLSQEANFNPAPPHQLIHLQNQHRADTLLAQSSIERFSLNTTLPSCHRPCRRNSQYNHLHYH